MDEKPDNINWKVPLPMQSVYKKVVVHDFLYQN